MKLSRLDCGRGFVSRDTDVAAAAGDNEATRAMKPAGDEYERIGEGREVGAKRKDLVDQVFTRCKGVSDPEALRLLPMNVACSEVGVDGGVFADANTSNWRER